ncbi:hypothetical protein GCM10009647_019590 [Streptomyces sanglieri]
MTVGVLALALTSGAISAEAAPDPSRQPVPVPSAATRAEGTPSEPPQQPPKWQSVSLGAALEAFTAQDGRAEG